MYECPLQDEHIKSIATLETKVDMLGDVLDLTKSLHDTLIDMSTTNKTIMMTLEMQGESQRKMLQEIEDIKDIMGTKESIVRLHKRDDDIEKRLETLERAPEKEGASEYKKIKNLVFGVVGTEVTLAILAGLKLYIF